MQSRPRSRSPEAITRAQQQIGTKHTLRSRSGENRFCSKDKADQVLLASQEKIGPCRSPEQNRPLPQSESRSGPPGKPGENRPLPQITTTWAHLRGSSSKVAWRSYPKRLTVKRYAPLSHAPEQIARAARALRAVQLLPALPHRAKSRRLLLQALPAHLHPEQRRLAVHPRAAA